MKGCKLSCPGLGLALGVLWGVSTLLMGLLDHHFAFGHSFVSTMGSIYPGYVPTIAGSILGGVIGFINGFITGFLIAWLYNIFSCCECLCCDNKKVEVKAVKTTNSAKTSHIAKASKSAKAPKAAKEAKKPKVAKTPKAEAKKAK